MSIAVCRWCAVVELYVLLPDGHRLNAEALTGAPMITENWWLQIVQVMIVI